MAFKQSVIFTVLPFGVVTKTDGTYLNFSVLVSPRLENTSSTAPPTKLTNYPDWATGRTWPQTVAALKSSFRLRLRAQGLDATYPATIVGQQRPDSARFEKIFPADTDVTPYKYRGFEHRRIRSAPVAAAVDVIQALYGRFGLTSPLAFPAYGDLAPVGSFGAIGFEQDADFRTTGGGNTMSGLDRKAKLTAALERKLETARAIPPPEDLKKLAESLNIPGALISMEFLQHQRFLQRGLPKQHTTHRPPKPDWDFHQMVAGLSSMPTLLRVLGLVLDMQVGPVASADLSHGHVTASLELHKLNKNLFKLATTPVLPTTYSALTQTEFLAAAKSGTASDHVGRMLKLGDAKVFQLIRVDHDNAVVKSMQFANTVTRSRKAGGKPLTLTTPSRYALPALKTGGFAIAQSGRAVQMAAVLARQTAALEGGGGAPALYLDDVMRGYRFDVLDVADGIWRSLMWREGSIAIHGATGLPNVIEEDTVVPAPTTASRADHAGDLYLQETLTRWDGWSLAVPRIGEPFRGAGPRNAKSGSSGFNVTTEWHVPTAANATKLPRLRFGRSYRLRARASDLAGNALPVDAAPTDSAVITPALRHLRFEPVAAPRALLVDAPLPGASEEIVVIRSESATVDAAGPLDNGETERLLVPAPISVFMAEQHGVLDIPSTSGRPMNATAAAYGQLVTRDQHSVDDDRTNPGDPVSTTNPALYPKFLPIRYLPDVLGRTALVRGLPVNSNKETVATLPFDTGGAGWPNLQAARVHLSRGAPNWSTRSVSDPSTTSNVTTELDLTLDKGDMFTALVNCHIDQSAVSIMAIWEWIEQYAVAHGKDPAAVLNQILNGEHWMITPWRLVTFIHAVRTPLKNPQLFLIPAKTEIGQTFAAFGGESNFDAGTVLMSRKSTARIDVDATWSMPIDTGSNDDPVTPQNFSGHAFSLELTRNGVGFLPGPRTSVVSSPDAANFDLTHEFGDTKFRAVTYQATATSFYVEYFREQMQLSSGAHAVSDLQGHPTTPGVAFEESTVRMLLTWTTPGQNGADQAHARTLVRAPDGTDPKTGDANLGDYVVVADPTNGPNGTVQILTKAVIDLSGLDNPAVVFSYVGPVIHTFSDPTTDHTTALTVPNSKRPDAPDVLYVIPIYSRVVTGTQVTRKGGALRVYLKRPWWSSGAGERLGVVCWRKNSHSSAVLPPNDLAPYVTLWGYDPMFKTHRSLPGQPTPDCFPLHTATGSAMPIDETSERVDVAGHNVGFDATRGLWYCDIRVAAASGKELTAYMPFVRFAFARFQTHSITGAHLSKVVVADYAQLAPNRSVTMTGNGSTRTVTVAGRAPVRTDAADEPSKMLVTIEQRDIRIADDDLAWTPTSAKAVELRASVSDSDFVTWTGTVTIPSSSKPLRLAFEEFERIAGNDSKGRLIFTETMPLTVIVNG